MLARQLFQELSLQKIDYQMRSCQEHQLILHIDLQHQLSNLYVAIFGKALKLLSLKQCHKLETIE